MYLTMILDIPLEITLNVFENLDALDLMRCRQVCQYFYDIITTEAPLVYKVKLHQAGMADDHTMFPSMSIPERLRRLHTFLDQRFDIQENWDDRSTKHRGLGLGTYSAGISVTGEDGGLCCMRLDDDKLPLEMWSYQVMTTEYQGFLIDYNQDLLLVMDLVGNRICFRPCNIGDGHPHILATLPHFLGQGEDARWDTATIFEDVIAVTIPEGIRKRRIEILNWKQGITVTSIDISDSLHSAFTFLDSSHLLTWCHRASGCELRVYALPGVPGEARLTLVLPIPHIPGQRLGSLGGAFYNGYQSIRPPHRRRHPFRSCNEDAVIALSMQSFSSWNWTIVFPRSAILLLLQTQTSASSSLPVRVPWGTWPKSTLSRNTECPLKIWVHGSRVGITTARFRKISIFQFSGYWFSKGASRPPGGTLPRSIPFPLPVKIPVASVRGFAFAFDDEIMAVEVDGNIIIGKVSV